jgi:hypothetical protein
LFFAMPLIGVLSVAIPTGVVDGLPTRVLVKFREDFALDAA